MLLAGDAPTPKSEPLHSVNWAVQTQPARGPTVQVSSGGVSNPPVHSLHPGSVRWGVKSRFHALLMVIAP